MIKEVERHTKKIGGSILNSLGHIVVFAAAFAILGQVMPQLYFEHIDKTEYLKFEAPASTDRKVYLPCDSIRLLTIRTNPDNIDVENNMTLVKINENNSFTKFAGPILHFVFGKGERVPVTGKFSLPCDAEEGIYFYEGINKFEVKNIKKQQYYISEQFFIASDEARLKEIEQNLLDNLPPFSPRPTSTNQSQTTPNTNAPTSQSSQSQQPQNVNQSTTVNNPPANNNQQPQPTPLLPPTPTPLVCILDPILNNCP